MVPSGPYIHKIANMPSSPGDFGGPKGPVLCTAKSKRTGKQCRMPAIKGSRTQKCRMHGGNAAGGLEASNFIHGRHSRYLPSELDDLYKEALSNPDLLDLSEHIALLETRIKDILRALAEDGTVPRWSQVAEVFGGLETAILSGNVSEVMPALEQWHEFLEQGVKWDRSWGDIQGTLDTLRKVTEAEVKRKRDLNHMIPVERVVTLMAAVAAAVKRNVTDPSEIQAVYREMELMHSSNRSLDPRGGTRVPNNGRRVIDVPTT